MAKTDKNKITLRNLPTQATTQLNKKLIILAIFSVLLLIIIIVSSSLSPNLVKTKHFNDTSQSSKILVDKPAILQNLPQDYQSLQAQKTRYSATITPKKIALQETDDTNTNSARHNNADSNLQDQQAIQSHIFFATPVANTVNNINSDNKIHLLDNLKDNLKDNLNFKNNNIYNQGVLTHPASPYEVLSGTVIPAILLTEINTSQPGSVVVQVEQDIYDTVKGIYLLIPKGSKILGIYQAKVNYGDERVAIAFNRIIFPNGDSIMLNDFTGIDLTGASGTPADVNNHWGKILGAATISTLLSVGAGVASENYSDNNVNYMGPTQSAILGGANSISNTGQALTARAMNIQPTLIVHTGFLLNILVNKDLILTPYN